jgi:cellulose synthase/poly-beta-1,6-N-acetylglucosamine synthase-like glycosyltransferase
VSWCLVFSSVALALSLGLQILCDLLARESTSNPFIAQFLQEVRKHSRTIWNVLAISCFVWMLQGFLFPCFWFLMLAFFFVHGVACLFFWSIHASLLEKQTALNIMYCSKKKRQEIQDENAITLPPSTE